MSSDRVPAALPRPARPATRRLLRVGALTASAALVLAACSDDAADAGDGEAGAGSAALEEIQVEGGFGEEPTITFEEPFALEQSASDVLSEGDGEEIEAGDTVTIDYAIVSGSDGSPLDTSFGAVSISLPLIDGQTTPALVEALVGQTIGSRVLVAVAPEPSADPSGPVPSAAPGDPAGDTIVFVLDLLSLVPERAEGEPVEQPEGTPVVQTDEAGDVTGLDVEGVTAPEELVVTPVLQGDGDEVGAGDTVTIHYTGVLAADGTPFDSSWERDAAATFPLTNLIQGWQEGLEGVPVGSRVVLQVPSELGYGAAGSPPTIPADADLVFVIDVLATQPAPEAPSAPSPAPSE